MNPLRAGIAGILTIVCAAIFLSCGGSDSGKQTVSGVAAAGAPIFGNVTLKDNHGYQLGPVATDSHGNFSFDVTGLLPPFLLKAEGQAGDQDYTLYSAMSGPGKANINPFSNLAVTVATGLDPARVFGPEGERPDSATITDATLNAAIAAIKAWIQPLLGLYGIADFNPIAGDYTANPNDNLDAMLDLVKVQMDNGSLVISNRLNGLPIVTVNLNDTTPMSIFNPGNAPDPSVVGDLREITIWAGNLCTTMNKGASLTTQDLEPFIIPDPDYGTSSGHTRSENVASILAIFGPGAGDNAVKLDGIRNVRIKNDLTSAYPDRGVSRVYSLVYDFIYVNGTIKRGNIVTLGKETASDGWVFIGDPAESSGTGDNNGGFIVYMIISPPPPPLP